MTFVHLRKCLLLNLVFFNKCKLKPDELPIEVPKVYAYYLRVLCFYHLRKSRQCWNSRLDLQLTIEDNYCITHPVLKSIFYFILGISFRLLGDMESAVQAFMHFKE